METGEHGHPGAHPADHAPANSMASVMANALKCPICMMDGGAVIWRSERIRVIQVDDSAFPGYCRIIWNMHVKEMTDLDERERQALLLHRADAGGDRRRLARSARAPEQYVMGGMTLGEAARILEAGLLLRVDAGEQRIVDRLEVGDGGELLSVPTIGGVGFQIDGRRRRRSHALQCVCDAGQQSLFVVGHGNCP